MIWLLLLALRVAADGVWLTWELPAYPVPGLYLYPECTERPAHLYLHEAYLGPGTGIWDYYDGVRLLPAGQTSLHLSPGKPEVGCGVMWGGGDDQGAFIPLAHDPLWQALPIECQPYNLRADGLTWEGL